MFKNKLYIGKTFQRAMRDFSKSEAAAIRICKQKHVKRDFSYVQISLCMHAGADEFTSAANI